MLRARPCAGRSCVTTRVAARRMTTITTPEPPPPSTPHPPHPLPSQPINSPPPLPPVRVKPQVKPLRRVLFMVPGSEQKKIQKALGLGLDSIVLDLEDGVASNQKEKARAEISASLSKDDFGASERVVRINTIRSGLGISDLQSLTNVIDHIDSILIPKVESSAEVAYVSTVLDHNCGARARHIKFLACIESARGLVDLAEICRKSPKLSALIVRTTKETFVDIMQIGTEDLCANMGMTRTTTAFELLYARSHVATHAHAFGLDAIDMVCVDYKDLVTLAAEAVQGSQMGFTGKQAIHPAQVPVIYDSFKPSQDVLDHAKRILEENETHQAAGRGAFSIDGKMIDAPMVKWAQVVLNRVPREEKKKVSDEVKNATTSDEKKAEAMTPTREEEKKEEQEKEKAEEETKTSPRDEEKKEEEKKTTDEEVKKSES